MVFYVSMAHILWDFHLEKDCSHFHIHPIWVEVHVISIYNLPKMSVCFRVFVMWASFCVQMSMNNDISFPCNSHTYMHIHDSPKSPENTQKSNYLQAPCISNHKAYGAKCSTSTSCWIISKYTTSVSLFLYLYLFFFVGLSKQIPNKILCG